MLIEEKTVQRTHNLRLEQNKTLYVSGVKNVPTFNDKQIVVDLGNQNLIVAGDNLNITTLDLDSGNLTALGRVTSLKYTASHDAKSFFNKVFK